MYRPQIEMILLKRNYTRRLERKFLFKKYSWFEVKCFEEKLLKINYLSISILKCLDMLWLFNIK
jgi:hypothetical protein